MKSLQTFEVHTNNLLRKPGQKKCLAIFANFRFALESLFQSLSVHVSDKAISLQLYSKGCFVIIQNNSENLNFSAVHSGKIQIFGIFLDDNNATSTSSYTISTLIENLENSRSKI